MRSALTTALLTLALALAACGGDSSSTEGTSTVGPGSSSPLVEFDKSGGIAYTAQSLSVEPSGESSLKGTGTKATFTLSEDELSRLQQALDEHPIDSLGTPPTETGCADCYAYRLRYGGGVYEADESSISAEASDVVAVLGDLIAAHEPPGSGY
jgi:hypothetical protein